MNPRTNAGIERRRNCPRRMSCQVAQCERLPNDSRSMVAISCGNDCLACFVTTAPLRPPLMQRLTPSLKLLYCDLNRAESRETRSRNEKDISPCLVPTRPNALAMRKGIHEATSNHYVSIKNGVGAIGSFSTPTRVAVAAWATERLESIGATCMSNARIFMTPNS